MQLGDLDTKVGNMLFQMPAFFCVIIAQSNRQSLSDGLTTCVIENDALAQKPSAAPDDMDAPIAPPSLFRKRWASSISARNMHSDTSEEEARAQPGLKLLSRKANMS